MLGIFGGLIKSILLGIIKGGVIVITDGTDIGPNPVSTHGKTIGGKRSWLFTVF